MNITLLRIDTSASDPDPQGQRCMRVCIEVDGVAEWHEVRVQAKWLPQSGAGLIEAGDSLRARLAGEPNALYRICKLAARELRGQDVHLPELVAA